MRRRARVKQVGGGVGLLLAALWAVGTNALDETPDTGIPRLVSDAVVHGDDYLGTRFNIFGYLIKSKSLVDSSSDYYIVPFPELVNGNSYDTVRYLGVRIDLRIDGSNTDSLPGCIGDLVDAHGLFLGHEGDYTLVLEDMTDFIISHSHDSIVRCY